MSWVSGQVLKSAWRISEQANHPYPLASPQPGKLPGLRR